MARFNRFGNMFPPLEVGIRSYLMAEEPFQIYGNLYFVGNTWCSSHLIDTGEGLILLDTPCLHDLAYLINNIYKLGFKLADLKYIVVSHEHLDHYGSVRALVHLTGAKTFTGKVAAAELDKILAAPFKPGMEGRWDEAFDADVRLDDGDVIELGNTKIRAMDTPGHSIGCQSHFWTAYGEDGPKKVGIYGGAGFGSLSTKSLQARGMSLEWQQIFLKSIEHVYNEEVDIVLGNHPFHNDTYDKHEQSVKEGINAFIDPTEWKRSLDELKACFLQFLDDEKNGVVRDGRSQFLVYRDICTKYLDHPENVNRDIIDYYKYYR